MSISWEPSSRRKWKSRWLSLRGSPGKYVVLVDPIDGSSNLDVDCVVGSIFAIRDLKGSVEESILSKGVAGRRRIHHVRNFDDPCVQLPETGCTALFSTKRSGSSSWTTTCPHARSGKDPRVNFGNYDAWSDPAKNFVDALTRRTRTAIRCAIQERSLPIFIESFTEEESTSTPRCQSPQGEAAASL